MVTAKVYKHYRLGRVNGNNYSLDSKTLQREDVIIPPSIAEKNNENWKDSGDFYELNEEATETFVKERQAQLDEVEFRKSSKIAEAKQTLGEVFEKVAVDSLKKESKENESGSELGEDENNITKAQLKALCEEKDYPKEEWNNLNKTDLIEYLASKKV